MKFIPDLDKIPDAAYLTFAYLDKIDERCGPDGQPRKPWRMPLSTLERAAKEHRLKTTVNNKRAVWGRDFKAYILDRHSIKVKTSQPNKGANDVTPIGTFRRQSPTPN